MDISRGIVQSWKKVKTKTRGGGITLADDLGRDFDEIDDFVVRLEDEVEGVVSSGNLADRLDDYTELAERIKKLPDNGEAFLVDFATASDDVIEQLGKNPDWVEAWEALDDVGIDGLAGNVDNLKTTNKWLDEGLDQSKLTQALKGSPNGQKLIDDLSNSKSIYHAQVYVGDLDNIPGVAEGPFTPNSLTTGKTASWGDPDLDLPLREAATFADAESIELSAGTKLYRVTGGNPAGGYWTLEPPTNVGDVIGGTAVRPEWNSFEKMYVYEVPSGERLRIWKGKTAGQKVADNISDYHLPGGDEQVFIPEKLRGDAFKKLVKETSLPW